MIRPFLLLLVAPALGQKVGMLTVSAPVELVPQAAALPETAGAVEQGAAPPPPAEREYNLTSMLASAASDPSRLGRTVCDVNPAASVPTLSLGGGMYLPASCTNAATNQRQLQAA